MTNPFSAKDVQLFDVARFCRSTTLMQRPSGFVTCWDSRSIS